MKPYIEPQDPLLTLGEMDNRIEYTEEEFWAITARIKEYDKAQKEEKNNAAFERKRLQEYTR